MIGRRAVIGLSLLSALLFCALAAQSASAIVTVKSNNTTAFTCVKDPLKKGDFNDAHCDITGVKGASEYKHDLIPLDTTTEVEATNEKVTESTTKPQPATLKGTVAGVKSEIHCNKVKNVVKNSLVHNVQPAKEQHTFTGTIETEFTDCSVSKPAKCDVAEPIISKAEVHGVEGMEGPKGEKNAMGLEFIGHGAEETFATIEYINNGAEICALKGAKFKVKGRVVATNGPTTESAQENRESGATLVFTPKFKMQTLTLGGNPSEFETIVTPTMAGGGNPISMTTTTPE